MARKAGEKTGQKATIDPKLARELAGAPAESPVEAVFTLKTPAGESYRSATSAREAMTRMVEKASADAKVQPYRLTLFPNVQSFAVSGPPALVRKLAENAQVASAMANRQDEDLLIRPVKPGPKKAKKTTRKPAKAKKKA
jgi:hypothetical protein